ncbi:MAG: 2-phosphosulfolactate phosphatase [Bacteroidales bacterium]
MPVIEVCLSPLLFPVQRITQPYIIVLIDILRASTTICTALHYGVTEIIPVASLDEARAYKSKGFLVAGERDGSILDFADVGNSPGSFMTGEYRGKTLVFTTTNGTVALTQANEARTIVIGAFSNLGVLSEWLTGKGEKGDNVLLMCSGWYNQFSLEDSLFAGCLSSRLLKTGLFTTDCDAAKACVDLWKTAESDVFDYVRKASHMKRLTDLNLTHDLEFCFTPDTLRVIPVLDNNRKITALETRPPA